MNIIVQRFAVLHLLQVSPRTRGAGRHRTRRERGNIRPPGVQVQPVRQNRKRFSYDVRRHWLIPKLLVLHDYADGPLDGLRTRRPPREGGRTHVAGSGHVGQVPQRPAEARRIQTVVAVEQGQFRGKFGLVRVSERVEVRERGK